MQTMVTSVSKLHFPVVVVTLGCLIKGPEDLFMGSFLTNRRQLSLVTQLMSDHLELVLEV